MGKLVLTNLGAIAVRHGTCTSPQWFRDQYRSVAAELDEGGDGLLALDERIAGLTELRDAINEHGYSWLELAVGSGDLADDFITDLARPSTRTEPAEPGVDMSDPNDHGVVRRLP